MRVIGYPTEWDEAEGLLPIDIQDVQLEASPDELRRLGEFLTSNAARIEKGLSPDKSLNLPDSKDSPQTPITFLISAATRG